MSATENQPDRTQLSNNHFMIAFFCWVLALVGLMFLGAALVTNLFYGYSQFIVGFIVMFKHSSTFFSWGLLLWWWPVLSAYFGKSAYFPAIVVTIAGVRALVFVINMITSLRLQLPNEAIFYISGWASATIAALFAPLVIQLRLHDAISQRISDICFGLMALMGGITLVTALLSFR